MSPTSLLLLLCVCFACIAAIRPGIQAQAACEPKQCGNLTVSSPFGISSGSQESRCADGSPYLGYYEPGFGLQILNIFFNNGSLLVFDIHELQDFDISNPGGGCRGLTANTATKIGHPFSISAVDQNLIFYNCIRAPALGMACRAGLVDTVCQNNTFVRVGGRYNETGGIDDSYALPGCATTVPVLGTSGEANASNYEELISEGLLLTWQLPATGSSGKLTCPS